MNNNFNQLKKETIDVIINNITNNEKAVLEYINTILTKCGSKLNVRKNMSIKSFETLLINSSSIEEFAAYLNKLEQNKDYEILDIEGLNDSIKFNEEFSKKDLEAYQQYKKFLESRIKLNDNLYIIEYPKN